MDFRIHPRSKFSHRNASFKKPEVIGFFSTDDRINYKGDASQIKFLRVPNGEIHYDLNHRLDKTKKWITHETTLSVLLKHLLRENSPLGSSTLRDAPFVTHRFALKVVATAIYDTKHAKKLSACLFQGCIYMCKLKTEKEREKYNKMTYKRNLAKLRRGNLNQYMLVDDPKYDQDNTKDVDDINDEVFHCVFRSKLNNHKLLYAANIDGLQLNDSDIKIPDCQDSPKQYIAFLQNAKLINIKTRSHVVTSEQRRHHQQHRIIHWWTQNFLVGTQTVFCGYHDIKGVVSEIKTIEVKDFVTEGQKYWRWTLVLKFLDYFLNYVRECFDKELKKKYGNLNDVDIRQLAKMDLIFDISSMGDVKMSIPTDVEDVTCVPSWYVSESAAVHGEHCERTASGSQSGTS